MRKPLPSVKRPYLGTIVKDFVARARKDDFDMWGRAEDMTAQIVGVLFENGEVWGELDSQIDARDAWVGPLRSEK